MKNTKEWIRLALPVAVSLFLGIVTQNQFIEGLATLAGIVTLVPIFVEWAKTQWNLSGKKWLFGWAASRWISWLLSIGFVVLSWAVGFGFGAMPWYKALTFGVGAGLVSNGYFTLEQIQTMLAIVFGRTDKLQTLEAIAKLKNK